MATENRGGERADDVQYSKHESTTTGTSGNILPYTWYLLLSAIFRYAMCNTFLYQLVAEALRSYLVAGHD